MKRTLARGAVVALALLVGLTSLVPVATAADPIPTERLLPRDVSVYVTVSNVNEFKQRWNQSLTGQLIQDESLAPFRADVKKQLDELSTQLHGEVGVTLNDLLELPSGEFSFAVMHLPGKPLVPVAFLDFGDGRPTVEVLLDKAAKALEEQGAQRSETDIEDTRVVTYTLPEKDADENDPAPDGNAPKSPTKIVYFLKDTFFVVSGDELALEAVLARWDGQHSQTFADNDVYRYIKERTKSPNAKALLNWYIDPLTLLQRVITAGPQAGVEAQMVLGFLPMLGLNKLKAFGGTFDMVAGDFDSVSRSMVYVETPPAGVLNVFQFPAIEQAPPQWVSARASTYFGLNWDISTAYTAVEALVDMLQGPGTLAAMIDGLAQQEGGPNLHLKADLIDQLSGRIHVASYPSSERDTEMETQQFLIAVGLREPDKMRATLSKIANAEGFPGEIREFQSEIIYDIPAAGGAGVGGPGTMSVAVTQGHLMVAPNTVVLESAIRGEADQPLASADDYRRVAAHFPPKTSIIGFQKQYAQLKSLYDMARSGALAAFVPNVDFSTLPPFGQLEKYFRPTGTYAVPDERGALFVSFSLREG